ncbi:MAG: hypothetical protein IJU79_02170 [Desulfovibrionaceae bacterium]|nr:hypothetical protein [Desulfovibrionaceae bacterium]
MKKIILIIFIALSSYFPISALAKDVIEIPPSQIEEEINIVQSLMSDNIKNFLNADTRLQLCVISLWIAGNMKNEQAFIKFVEKLGLRKFQRVCTDILLEMKAVTKDVQGIGDLPAFSFFIMCSNNLVQKYAWLSYVK